MKLVAIQAETSDVMSLDERSHIRRILGVSEVVTDTYYEQSEDTFNLISKRLADGITAEQDEKNIYRCKEMRLLYKSYDKIGDDTTVVDGGRDGIKTSAELNRMRFAIQLWKRIFPSNVPIPNEDIFSRIDELEKSTGNESSTFKFIPVIFNEYTPGDEYNG